MAMISTSRVTSYLGLATVAPFRGNTLMEIAAKSGHWQLSRSSVTQKKKQQQKLHTRMTNGDKKEKCPEQRFKSY